MAWRTDNKQTRLKIDTFFGEMGKTEKSFQALFSVKIVFFGHVDSVVLTKDSFK